MKTYKVEMIVIDNDNDEVTYEADDLKSDILAFAAELNLDIKDLNIQET